MATQFINKARDKLYQFLQTLVVTENKSRNIIIRVKSRGGGPGSLRKLFEIWKGCGNSFVLQYQGVYDK